MVNKIYKRQIGFLLILILPITKVILLPSLLASISGRDCYFTIFIFFILDFLSVYSILKAREIAKGESVFKIFEKNFGKVFTKIFMMFYLLLFLFRVFPFDYEQKMLLNETIYFNMQRILVFLPILLVASYIAYKGFTVIGRNADLMFMTAIGSFVTLFFLALASVDFSNLLPVLSNGVGNVFNGVIRYSFYFGDGIFIMFLFDSIKENTKQKNFHILMWLAISYILVMLFFILFVSVFSNTAPFHYNAIEKIAKYNETFSFLGRIDLLSVIPLLAGAVFNIAVCLAAGIKIFSYIFNVRKRLVSTILVTILLMILVAVLSTNVEKSYVLYENIFSYFFIFLQYFVPFILPILSLNKIRRERYVKEFKG